MSEHEQPRWVFWVAGAVTLVVYALSASGHGYWLDSGEFSAAAVGLDIPHPPGHPLANLWGKAFSLLPVGPLAYRVALGQAAAAALAVAFTARAIERTVYAVAELARFVRCALALAAAFLLAGAYGFWFQGVRAEVYALQALLVCMALERVSVLAVTASDDVRPLYAACLALGFGLANHHFIAVLALPMLAWETVRLTRALGARVIGSAALAGALGLLSYVYLPLRAAREPLMDLGHPTTWSDFWWVVSARVYARNIGSEALQPLGERFADLLVLLIENFTLATLLFALLGSYALVRKGELRLAYLWLSTAFVSLCGRAYLNPVRANPDVLGYMMPGFAALVALAAAGLAALLSALPARMRRALPVIATASVLLALLQFPRERARASLRTFTATDPFDDLRRRELPTRALLVLTTPESVFRHWEGEASEALRGDVTLVPVPFLGYGSMHEALLRKHPELRALVADYLARGALSAEQLAALARTRPVLVELDTRAALSAYDASAPEGLLYRVGAGSSASREKAHARLRTRLADQLREPETRKQLLWNEYVAALYFAHHGELTRARSAVASGLALSPHTRELVLLARALSQRKDGALDIRPFLPEHAR